VTRTVRWLIAIAAAIALADGSIVTLALPQILSELHTSVEGVAAVLGVYCAVLAIALPVAVRLGQAFGTMRVGLAGLVLLAVASLGCAVAGSLAPLLLMRAAQGLGGAAVLLLGFDVLRGASGTDGVGRGMWTRAAIFGTAVGPALGGVLTQAFSWRAIFIGQAPVALAAAVACVTGRRIDTAPRPTAGPPRAEPAASAGASSSPALSLALALAAAALSAVLFLVVLLLVSGWGLSPLHAAVVLMLLPASAVAAGRARGSAGTRAASGCALLAAGVVTFAFLPRASTWWLVAPLILAGLGMGLALPALAGELLPERTAADAGRLLALRHAAIALTLLALAPLIAGQLRSATEHARLQGVAALLDSPLSPDQKLALAPAFARSLNNGDPRRALAREVAAARGRVGRSDQASLTQLQAQGDAIIVDAAADSLRYAFLIAGALGLLAALIIGPRPRLPATAMLATVTLVIPVGYAVAKSALPSPVPPVRGACQQPSLPSAGGISGALQNLALSGLDQLACLQGVPREQLLLRMLNAR
jgi:predicted MFS family arabinose efflux permease